MTDSHSQTPPTDPTRDDSPCARAESAEPHTDLSDPRAESAEPCADFSGPRADSTEARANFYDTNADAAGTEGDSAITFGDFSGTRGASADVRVPSADAFASSADNRAQPAVAQPTPTSAGAASAGPPPPPPERTGRAAFFVATGIFISRLAGLFRQTAFAHFFGASPPGDAFQAAFRIPNLLQNLFGEGVLSASFIPEYAALLARGDTDLADQVAGAVLGALALVASAVVVAGVLTAPYLVDILAGGFNGPTRALAITLVRILFPGAALLVFSAWCLGILNSHRKFLISYLAPVAWNVVMIATLVIFGPNHQLPALATTLAWGSVLGSAAQFLVQLPTVIKVAGRIAPNVNFKLPSARRVFTTFSSAFLSRGVVQISAFVDIALASYLPIGTISSLAYGQTIYLLPGSLFGMSVTAAELPAMSSALGTPEEIATYLRTRLNAAMQRIAYFIVPCVAAFLALGDVIIAALLQTGHFRHANTIWVWEILAGSTVGLLASTLGRLDSSTYYALRDTRTPLNFAIVRIVLTTILGVLFAFGVPRWFHLDPKLGAAGLTASAGIAGWLEFILLRRTLTRRIGRTGLSLRYVAKLWLAALAAVALASATRPIAQHAIPPIPFAAIALTLFAITYLTITTQLKIPDALLLTSKLRRSRRVQLT